VTAFLTRLLHGLNEKALFIRFFHWSLVTCVVLNLFILEESEKPHTIVGYIASALIIARFIWGYFKETSVGGPNWLATANMYLMLGLVLVLGISGFMMGTDRFFGEEWVEKAHEISSYALEAAIILHLAGVFKDTLFPSWGPFARTPAK
jgi:cytochrome b